MEKDKKEWEGKEWSKEAWEAAMDAKKQKGSAADESGQDNEAITRAREHKGRPLKCLCLHGGDMNGASFDSVEGILDSSDTVARVAAAIQREL